VGDRWIYNPSDSTPFSSEAVSYESVTVPAGTFECFKTIFPSPGYPGSGGAIFQWYAKNVGLVKLVQGPVSGGVPQNNSIVLELQSKNF